MKGNPIGTICLLFAFDGTVLPQILKHNKFCVSKWKKGRLLFVFKNIAGADGQV